MSSAAVPVELELPALTVPQAALIRATERYVLLEGSPGSAKSWAGALKIWDLVHAHPGIQIYYCRYQDSGVRAQLLPLWAHVAALFPDYVQPVWDAATESFVYANGSRVYVRSLKSSEITAIHAKYKGLTLAVVIVEEAAEVPEVHLDGLRERLRQVRHPDGTPHVYPLQIVLITNCVDEDHYLAKLFPTDNSRPDHRHIRADVHSNRRNLGAATIAAWEADYPPGHMLRPTKIEGRRGVSLLGQPVYGGYFDRAIHVSSSAHINPHYPLLEGWDFGHEKPAVVWAQYLAHAGAVIVLGGVKGADVFIETFAPKVLELRARLFPHVGQHVLAWCDPAGATTNAGTVHTPVRTLQDLGVPARYTPTANQPEERYAAIQVLAGYMGRLARDGGPAFTLHPRCVELVRGPGGALVEQDTELLATAFGAGYIWDTSAPSDAHPNIRKPKKGTRYDDLMNALEYIVTGEQWSVPHQQQMLRAEQRLTLTARRVAAEAHAAELARASVGPSGESYAQVMARVARERRLARDVDPADRRYGRVRRTGRGGW